LVCQASGDLKARIQGGGITILADWDNIALKDRKVYVAFDSDVMVKAEVQQALARLTEHLYRKGAEVFHVILPDNKGKVGVDDYLLMYNASDLLKLAVMPLSPSPIGKDEPAEDILQAVMSGKMAPKDGVLTLREVKKVPQFVIRVAISNLAIFTLTKKGKFIKALDGRFYFKASTK